MAIPCNGKKDCKFGVDENWCDMDISYLFALLGLGLLMISVVAVVIQFLYRPKRIKNGIEMKNLNETNQTLEEQHQNGLRGKIIAFFQGSKDRKQKNKDLIASECSYHDNFVEAILCIKVGRMFYTSFFLNNSTDLSLFKKIVLVTLGLFFTLSRTFFHHSMSERFWKQNTIVSKIVLT